MFIAPPGMFSTIVGLPHFCPSCSATMRAKVSVVEPGSDGTTNLMVRAG